MKVTKKFKTKAHMSKILVLNEAQNASIQSTSTLNQSVDIKPIIDEKIVIDDSENSRTSQTLNIEILSDSSLIPKEEIENIDEILVTRDEIDIDKYENSEESNEIFTNKTSDQFHSNQYYNFVTTSASNDAVNENWDEGNFETDHLYNSADNNVSDDVYNIIQFDESELIELKTDNLELVEEDPQLVVDEPQLVVGESYDPETQSDKSNIAHYIMSNMEE